MTKSGKIVNNKLLKAWDLNGNINIHIAKEYCCSNKHANKVNTIFLRTLREESTSALIYLALGWQYNGLFRLSLNGNGTEIGNSIILKFSHWQWECLPPPTGSATGNGNGTYCDYSPYGPGKVQKCLMSYWSGPIPGSIPALVQCERFCMTVPVPVPFPLRLCLNEPQLLRM